MATFQVRVVPRAGKSQIAGRRGDALVVRLAAAPVDGAANAALIEVLSAALDCPRRAIAILSGEKSRDKRIQVDGLSELELTARLARLSPPR